MSNIPKLRFKEFSGDWEETSIGDVCQIFGRIGYRGYTVNDIVEKGKGAIALSPSNMIENRIRVDNATYISWFKYEESPEIKVYNGDILIVKTGSTYGKTALVTSLEEAATLNPQIVVLKNIKINNIFLSYIIGNSIIQKQIEELVVGGAIPTMSQKELAKMQFHIPMIDEQEKIASFLSANDTKIDFLTCKKELLEQYKKGVMQKIFSQELRFKADDGSEFPEWEEKKLGDVCLIKKGSQLNRDGLDIVGQYAVINGGISPSGYNDEWNTEANTITISEGGNSCGYVSFITEKFWSGGHCYTLENIKSTVKNEYLFQYLKAYEIQIMRLRVGSGLPNIQKGEISKFIVKIPYIDEQNKIANFLSAIDTKIDFVAKQLDEAKNFKKGLLQQMFV